MYAELGRAAVQDVFEKAMEKAIDFSLSKRHSAYLILGGIANMIDGKINGSESVGNAGAILGVAGAVSLYMSMIGEVNQQILNRRRLQNA